VIRFAAFNSEVKIAENYEEEETECIMRRIELPPHGLARSEFEESAASYLFQD
jgi:hypothetical protein